MDKEKKNTRRHAHVRAHTHTKGSKCNVTADPSAFRHGHFHFHHPDPSPIILPDTGEPGERRTRDTDRKLLERLSKREEVVVLQRYRALEC